MLKKFTVTAVAAALLTTTGCASIVSDSTYPVSIRSNPDNSSFAIYDEKGDKVHSGRTPTTVTLKAGDGYFSKAKYTLKFKKNGYEEQTVSLNPELDGWYIANILLGFPGLIGILVIDPISGAMFKLPETVQSDLSKSGSAQLENQTITFMLLDDVHPNQRKNLVKVN